ncbi:MAG: DUF47 family protein [Candidatus Bathyarchaeia archaeon]|nr:DUF47 family protein [Candidatus Bathyarchaeota archaeon]
MKEEGLLVVFPIESEPRIKRRSLSLCQEHLRKVIEVVRKIVQLIDAFAAGDANIVTQLYNEIQKMSDEVAASKRSAAQELAEIGAILINREDFLRFIFVTSDISELCKGISFRVLAIVERGWDIPEDIRRGIAELSSTMFSAMMRLRDMTFALGYGSTQVFEKAKEVEQMEKEVDNLYRRLELTVLEQNMEIPKILLTRDIIQLLEDTTDKIEDASNNARILALTL